MTRYESSQPHAVEDTENTWITTVGRLSLAARLWLPAGAATAPVPAILEYIPYRKRDFMRRRDEGMHRWFAGTATPPCASTCAAPASPTASCTMSISRRSRTTRSRSIAWIARQPWCSGRVGMMGKSWGAYNSLPSRGAPTARARRRSSPSWEPTIASPSASTSPAAASSTTISGGAASCRSSTRGRRIRTSSASAGGRCGLERLEAEQFWPQIWLEHQTLDAYWRHGSVCFDYEAITCPTWFWGGWADLYRDTPLAVGEELERAPQGHHGTVGTPVSA